MLEAHSPNFVRRIISFHGLGRSHTLIVAPGSSPYESDTSCKSLGYVLMGSRFLLFLLGKFPVNFKLWTYSTIWAWKIFMFLVNLLQRLWICISFMEMETLREMLNLIGVKLMGGVRNPKRNIYGVLKKLS